jgi:hypothetical protein
MKRILLLIALVVMIFGLVLACQPDPYADLRKTHLHGW